MAPRSHGGSDGPQRLSLGPKRSHFADRLLLGLVWDKLAIVAATEPERNLPAEVSAARFLIGLHLPDAFANAVTLGLGEGSGERMGPRRILAFPLSCQTPKDGQGGPLSEAR